MKLPRDVGGRHLADLLSRCGYEITRQTGSHLRLTSTAGDSAHHLTIPVHEPLKVGTLSAVLADVAGYLGMEKQELIRQLFER